MKKLKTLFTLFITMFKIGLFTFGGGYAMIAVIERELVERKKWINHEEFMDLVAIAESTPGPIAINSATYIGYKMSGFFGSVFATLGVAMPSFIIIFVISLFFDKFLSFKFVQYAFNGIQACVAFLIISAGFKMFKKLKKTPLSVILFILTVGCLVGFSLFAVDFSSIFYILIGGAIGVCIYLVSLISSNNEKINKSEKQTEENKQESKGDNA
ncbi:MAG: chromate transporter [Clostridia bacterium]|nr:chromate transporter [Clostridia bacterium]